MTAFSGSLRAPVKLLDKLLAATWARVDVVADTAEPSLCGVSMTAATAAAAHVASLLLSPHYF